VADSRKVLKKGVEMMREEGLADEEKELGRRQ
jgi:hypothetical protein